MTLLLLCWGSRNSCSCTGSTTSLCSSIPGTRIRTWWPEAVGSWPWTLQCTRSCTATTLHVLLVCTCLMCWLCSSPALRSLRWPWAWRCACSSTTGCHRVTAPPMWTISGGRGLCTSATCCSLQISSTKPTYGHETTVTRAKRPSPGKWNRMQQVEKEIVLKLWKKFYILTEYMFFVLLYLLIFPGTVLGSVWGVTNYPTIRFTVYRNSSRGCYNFSELIEYTSAKDFIVRLYVQLFNFFLKLNYCLPLWVVDLLNMTLKRAEVRLICLAYLKVTYTLIPSCITSCLCPLWAITHFHSVHLGSVPLVYVPDYSGHLFTKTLIKNVWESVAEWFEKMTFYWTWQLVRLFSVWFRKSILRVL